MSHFIAHTIRFSKDYKTFECKGGDNNVVPRSNEWTDPIPIKELYNYVQGGMIHLNGSAELICFINNLVSQFNFGGSWENEDKYYHIHAGYHKEDQEIQDRKKVFDQKFLKELQDGLKNLNPAKSFVIKINGLYIKRKLKSRSLLTREIKDAQRFSHYKANDVSKCYSNSEVINTAPEEEKRPQKQVEMTEGSQKNQLNLF